MLDFPFCQCECKVNIQKSKENRALGIESFEKNKRKWYNDIKNRL